jgi:hypothetical protein
LLSEIGTIIATIKINGRDGRRMTVITTIKINGRDGRTMTMDMETENGRGGTEKVVKTKIRALKRMKATELDEASEIPSFSYGQLPGTEVQVFFLKAFHSPPSCTAY